jgi:hypothetical protein
MDTGKWLIQNFPLSVVHFHSQLFILSMQPMAAAATAELVELKPIGRVLFVLCRYVVALFALGAL